MSSNASLKQKFLSHLVKVVPFSGWSQTSMEETSQALGFDREFWKVLFEGGIDEAITLYAAEVDELMLKSLNNPKFKNLKTHERITEALKARIRVFANNRALMNKTIAYLANPMNNLLFAKLGWRTVDFIWHEIGKDTATDFNYYSKRSLLLGVYMSSLIYLQSDESTDLQDTMSFIDRRISDVMGFGKTINKVKSFFAA